MPMHGEASLEWDLLGTWWRPGPLLPHLRRNRALVHRMELGVGDAYPRGRGVHVRRGDVCGKKRRKAMARCHEGHATQSQSTDQQPQQYRREDPVSELGHARGTRSNSNRYYRAPGPPQTALSSKCVRRCASQLRNRENGFSFFPGSRPKNNRVAVTRHRRPPGLPTSLRPPLGEHT